MTAFTIENTGTAIWDDYILTGSVSNADALSWTTVATVTIENPSGLFIMIDFSINQDGGRIGGGGGASLTTRFRRVTGDVTLGTISRSISNLSAGSVSASLQKFIIDDAPTGSVTYAIEYQASGDIGTVSSPVTSSTGTVKFLWGKQ
jgi:hypothetical protein